MAGRWVSGSQGETERAVDVVSTLTHCEIHCKALALANIHLNPRIWRLSQGCSSKPKNNGWSKPQALRTSNYSYSGWVGRWEGSILTTKQTHKVNSQDSAC